MEILTLFLIGLSLSLDAFSLSLAYGLMGIKKKNIISFSLTVGFFHFFMPLVGALVGYKLLSFLKINPKYIIASIILLIILEMLKSIKDSDKIYEIKTNFISVLSFSFFVSLDSFTVGLGLLYITNYPIYAGIIFAIISGTFTFIGFNLGKFVSEKIGKISKYIGIFILLILLVYFII